MTRGRFAIVPLFALIAASASFGQMKGTGAMGTQGCCMGMDSSMHCMMGPHMKMSQSMVVATEGGIVVLSGTRLLKYDRDLNLIKEVEIKPDSLAMQRMMQMPKKATSPKTAPKTGVSDTTKRSR